MRQKPITFLFALLLVLLLSGLWFGIGRPVAGSSEDHVRFVITQGKGTRDIAFQLEEEGLIRFPHLFRVVALTLGKANNLQAGEYLLSPAMSPLRILWKLASGDVIVETITVVEGWNLSHIAGMLEAKGVASKEEFHKLAGFPGVDYRFATGVPRPKDFTEEFPVLQDKPSYVGLEGYLFPDTYKIQGGESAEDIIRKMLKNFNAKFTNEMRAETARQRKSIFAIVTMASLIEKEVQTEEDKKVVAGILWKRLDAGMPLQVDASVTYLTGKNSTAVTVEDTNRESPYNTYRYPGLPLGPIANPGLESMEAALYPTASSYWFYLSDPETNKTIFTRNFQEHTAAKAQYLKR